MNKLSLFPIAILLAADYAAADAPTAPTAPPKMTFHAFPAETKILTTDKVSPWRSEDTVLVVIKDNVHCGQKPVNASFAIKASQIVLHYELTPAVPDVPNCIVGSEFKIENVPHKDLAVAFSGGHEAATVVSMQKCPHYKPNTDDIWQCLVPK